MLLPRGGILKLYQVELTKVNLQLIIIFDNNCAVTIRLIADHLMTLLDITLNVHTFGIWRCCPNQPLGHNFLSPRG